MSVEVLAPELPESVSDANIGSWHKQPGDAVRRDENLVDLETDKVVLEVPAPRDGVLQEIRQAEGTAVQGGEVLAIIGEADLPTPPKPSERPPIPHPGPSARRALKETGVDPKQLRGSGPDGRLTRPDVLQAAAQPSTKIPPSALPGVPNLSGERPEQRVPMTRLRARVAERLVQAQQDAAILTTFNEVDLSAVQQLRRRHGEKFLKEHDIKLGFMSFFVKASVEALKHSPVLNASVDGNDIVYHGYFDIGIAVSSPRGLVVPILRDADQLGFAEIEQRIGEFAERAQAGSLELADLTGGTFTLSNGGVFGSLLSTPILNPPQSAILGMHTLQDRPVARDGQVVIRPMMYLALSYDHRLVDGREAVQFLVRIKQHIEEPERLMLNL